MADTADTVEVTGMDTAQRQLRVLSTGVEKTTRRAMDTFLGRLTAEATRPGDKSRANSPSGNYRWYVRGFGWRTRTGRSYPVSQVSAQRWQIRSQSDASGIVRNTAGYSGYLFGEQQVGWAKRRNWQRVDRWILDN
ncbi:MAG: hypothetical protein M9918_14515, partial [Anaerolineae bacterium]|nr:hypothetical protein [Anaerolineae bacterium]